MILAYQRKRVSECPCPPTLLGRRKQPGKFWLDDGPLQRWKIDLDQHADAAKAPGVVAEAKMYVKMWRDRGLCSRDYIDAWDDLLDHPQKAADMLEEQSPFAVQLRQNSPFVSVVRKYKLAHAA